MASSISALPDRHVQRPALYSLNSPRRDAARFQTRILCRVILVVPSSTLVIKHCLLFVPPACLALPDCSPCLLAIFACVLLVLRSPAGTYIASGLNLSRFTKVLQTFQLHLERQLSAQCFTTKHVQTELCWILDSHLKPSRFCKFTQRGGEQVMANLMVT